MTVLVVDKGNNVAFPDTLFVENASVPLDLVYYRGGRRKFTMQGCSPGACKEPLPSVLSLAWLIQNLRRGAGNAGETCVLVVLQGAVNHYIGTNTTVTHTSKPRQLYQKNHS
jgi:hypothetical protein